MSELTLAEMVRHVRVGLDLKQNEFAEKLGCSPQFICDLEKGHRTPSVAFVDRICDYLGRGPKGRKEWHVAAAKAHGWKI